MTDLDAAHERPRAAVCGFGGAATYFHLPLIAAAGFVPVAVFDPVESRRAAGLRHGFGSAYDIAELPSAVTRERIDVVIISSPNASHADHARTAMRAGANVIVEKPVAGSAAELAALLGVASDTGRTLIPFHNRIHDSDHAVALRIVRGGAIGRVIRVEATAARWGPANDYAARDFRPGWRKERTHGGGALADWAPHLLDKILDFAGIAPPLRTSAFSAAGIWSDEVDDVTGATLEWPHLVATLLVSLVDAAPAERFRICGTAGTIVVTGTDEKGIVAVHQPGGEIFPYPYQTSPMNALSLYRAVGDRRATYELQDRAHVVYETIDAIRAAAARPSAPRARVRRDLRVERVGDDVEWDDLVAHSDGGTAFHASVWTSASTQRFVRLGLRDGGTLVAGAVLQVDAAGTGCSGTLAPYHGPLVRTGSRQEVLMPQLAQVIADTVPRARFVTSPWTGDLQPFIGAKGFEARLFYTSVVDIGDLDAATARMAPAARRNLRAAARDLVVEETDAPENLLALVARTFARQGRTIWFDVAEAERCMRSLAAAGRARVFLARRADGRAVAGAGIVADHRSAYYLLGGYDEAAAHRGGSTAAIRAGMEWARRACGVRRFDLEGSHLPRIERFFRAFGGQWLPFYIVEHP
ncbi:MAG TPA: GNAT family N-acetyltransferase [Thermoanaerobaculia bacterium]|nr:GNAT family N-acetyltransferase [Thermoanaerobaculia bacterium]